ncbi:MAG: TIGR03000 domain-containing protein [Actinobacteria bacterium]|nr:TIGR03000 domain-containing protein [Actinomycetota bacterium]
MYSVMLMAALTTAPATEGWGRGCGGRGCHGSYGTRYTCSFNGFGCAGYGSGCFGCYGYPWYGSHGWHGAWGGYLGHGGHAPYGAFQCHGCYGCYGGHSCYGMPIGSPAIVTAPPSSNGPTTEKKKNGKIEETPPPKKLPEEQARANVTIELPADAKLYIDGNLMQTGSSRRTFRTPALVAGHTYYYDLRAEVIRDGRVVSETQRVLLRSGESAMASFPTLGTPSNATAQAR